MVVCFVHHSIDGSFNFANYLQHMIYTMKRYREKLPTSSLNVHHPEVCNESNLVLGATTAPWHTSRFIGWFANEKISDFNAEECESNDKMPGFLWHEFLDPICFGCDSNLPYQRESTFSLWSIENLGPLGVQPGSIVLTHAIPSCIFHLNGWIL